MSSIKAQLWRKIRHIFSIGSLTLRVCLVAGFGVVLGLFFLVAALAIVGERTTVDDFNHLLEVDVKTAVLSQKSIVSMMNARRYEKAFLMTYHEFGFEETKSRYVMLLQAELAAARISLAQMRQLVGNPDAVQQIAHVAEAIDHYETDFLAVVELHGQLGYIDSGLEGEFRDTADHIEALINKTADPELMIAFLTLRRYEKNYVLRTREIDSRAAETALVEFKKAVSVGIKGNRGSQLIALADVYGARFRAYVDTMHQIDVKNSRYLAAAQTIEPYLEHLHTNALAKSEIARAIIGKKAHRTEVLIEVGALIAVVLGLAVALAVSWRITTSIRETMTFAKRIAAGDLRTRSASEGQDEFAVLGHSLNHMASALQDAIRSRELRAFELEGINAELHNGIVAREQAEKDLRLANAELEQRVLGRTAELAKSEARFRSLADLSSDWYWEQDEEFRFVALTNGLNVPAIRSGVTGHDFIGKTRWETPISLTPEQWAAHKAVLHAHQQFSDFEFSVQRENLRPQWMSVSGDPQFDEHGTFTGYHGVGKDITERKEIDERIKHLSLHDVLTGLPNRALLQDRLHQALTYADRYSHAVWVLFIDLDNFKEVNDTFGHKAGDKVLSSVAKRLQSAVRESDTVARLGGDEFLLVLAERTNGKEILTAVERVMKRMAVPLTVNGTEILLGCSIGVATYPKDGADANTLIECADTAMYWAKQSGRNNVRFYEVPVQKKCIDA
ncbi:diguanylate cyclase domain-containing protein [Glaciimonas sp. GG7]